mgnify:CR=1 FL=1
MGVGSRNDINISKSDLDQILDRGMEWLVEQEMAWPEDAELCEERGSMRIACSSKVSNRAKSRGLTQIGTLGSGNHYCEVQLVDEVFDETAAAAMGLRLGQVVVMLHSGSRGLGHQVCTDYLQRIQRDAAEQAGLPYMQKSLSLFVLVSLFVLNAMHRYRCFVYLHTIIIIIISSSSSSSSISFVCCSSAVPSRQISIYLQ